MFEHTLFTGTLYTASKVRHASKWIALKKEGWPIISTWIHEAGEGQTSDYKDLWTRCVREACAASVTLVYVEEGDILKGGLVEVGAALAAGKPVFVLAGPEDLKALGSWVNHPKVHKYGSMSKVLEDLKVCLT